MEHTPYYIMNMLNLYSDNDLNLYYYIIPTQGLTLNPNLVHSPGWE